MSIKRIDKFLADAGIGTRTEIKAFIKKGYVTTNDQIVNRPETKINTDTDQVCFNGEPIEMDDFEYYLLNKPAGYVSATKDNTAPTVLSLLDTRRKDLFPVGRLDKDTEGLLLLTNDGELSHRLLSPKKHVDKTYYAVIKGEVTDEDIRLFANGLHIGDEDLDTALPSTLTIIRPYAPSDDLSYVHVTLQEGKFHQVKRMFLAVGKEVTYLQRISFGTLQLPADLPLGAYRRLTQEELQQLRG